MILKLLEKVVFGLNDKGVDYMLSGSVALNAYAVSRMTLDIDFVIELLTEDIKQLLKYKPLKIVYVIEWCEKLKLKTFDLL
jgi:hypothetical protein